MTYQLSFTELINYDAGQPGITVPVQLRLNNQQIIDCEAKLDTGSSFCIFARNIGEKLGIEIDKGIRQLIGTVLSNFVIYLHEVTLSFASIEVSALVGFAEDESFQLNVLGRRGFLEQVIVGLVDYEGQLYLSLYLAE